MPVTSDSTQPPPTDPALDRCWAAFCRWDATALELKKQITRYRGTVFLLGLLGAVLGTLSVPGALWTLESENVVRAIAAASGFSLALATFFSKEILTPDRERSWVRARAAAETLRAECLRYAAAVPPYADDATAPESLLARLGEVSNRVKGISSTNHFTKTPAPRRRLTVDEYIKERVLTQIDYFSRKSESHARTLARWRQVTFVLGGISVLLGAGGALYGEGAFAPWIAVLTTMGASIAAYLGSNRFQFLVTTYEAMREQLETLVAHWASKRHTDADTAARDAFIVRCEEALTLESKGWVAEWSGSPEKAADDVKAAAEAGTPSGP